MKPLNESPSASAAEDNTYQSKVLAELTMLVPKVKLLAVGAALAAVVDLN